MLGDRTLALTDHAVSVMFSGRHGAGELTRGAGGASRAIIYSFIMQGVKKIIITNRNKEKALKVVDNSLEVV